MKSLKRLFRRGPRARKNRPEPMQIQEYPPSSTAQPYADRTLPNSSSMNSHPPQVANIGPGVAPAGLVLDGYTQAGRHSLPPKTASDDQCSNGAAHSSKSDSTGTPPLLIDRLHDKSPNLKVCSDDHENTSRASFASDLSINYFGYLFGPDPSDG